MQILSSCTESEKIMINQTTHNLNNLRWSFICVRSLPSVIHGSVVIFKVTKSPTSGWGTNLLSYKSWSQVFALFASLQIWIMFVPIIQHREEGPATSNVNAFLNQSK
jgi:hypothetical protein